MKKLLQTFLLLTACLSGAVAQNCQPIDSLVFAQQKQQLAALDSNRTIQVLKFVRNYCLNCQKLTEILDVLPNEHEKLEVSQVAFFQLTDKQNFWQVYDKFSKFSTALTLYDFVTTQTTSYTKQDLTPRLPSDQKPCEVLEADVMDIVKQITYQTKEENKVAIAKQAVRLKCLRAEHIKKFMKLLLDDQLRIEFAKFSFDHITDKDNFYLVNGAFDKSESVAELNSFINQKLRR